MRNVAALERGLRLLLSLNVADGLRLSDAARQAGLHKTTALRLFHTLERLAFVHRDVDGRYAVGPALYVLARVVAADRFLAHLVGPALGHLSQATNEASAFFVRHGEERLCVAAQRGGFPIGYNLRIGELMPLDESAAAQILRRFATGRPPGPIDGALATSLGAGDPELAQIAAPVFEADGRLLGALTLAGTVIRFGAPGHLPTLQNVVSQRAAELNAALAPAGASGA
jgi:DNA-binding IclR family transcriptional regulator